jgi:hypothetical protein
MANITRFIDEKLPNSITSTNTDLLDKNHPFSFVRWIEYNKILFTDISDLLTRYKIYVQNWYKQKEEEPVADYIEVRDLYINLLNEIIINYSTADERRFLKNIDTNEKRDLAVAVPFFSEKIKDICLYYSTLRDKLPNTVVEYNLKGSNFGLQSLIYNEISKALEAQDLTDLIKSLNLSVSAVRNNTTIEIEEFYDETRNYLDLGTLPPSAYGVDTGTRKEFYNINTYDIKPDLFLDFDREIIDAIKAYPFYLIELGDNNFSVNVTTTSNDLQFLKDKDFQNLINNNDRNNLSLNLQSELTQKYMGTGFYYISTGSTGTEYVSGLLFEADSPFANYLNKNTPTVAAIVNEQNIKPPEQIGLFFKPDKIGLLTFANFSFTYSLSTENLSSNSLYIFPDPKLYGKVSGGTKQEQPSPLTFTSDNNAVKYDLADGYKFGEVVSDPLLPTYRGYQSREQSLLYSNQGVSRYVDPQDFFTGIKKNLWANPDVYPLIPEIEFPLDKRIQTLLPLNNKTLVQHKSDIYGNDYGLYKIIAPPIDTVRSVDALEEAIRLSYYNCLIVDGYKFFDSIYEYNFDFVNNIPGEGYTYTGVILRTSTAVPPGTGHYLFGPNLWTPSPLSASLYNNGVPSFLTPIPTVIASYGMSVESFCKDYLKSSFVCNIRDGFTFVSSTSSLLPDFPSDNVEFNSTLQVYYDILADAGLNSQGPGYRANNAYEGSFIFPPPLSTTVYDCSYFVVSSFSDVDEPCDDSFVNKSSLFLSNYYDNRIFSFSMTEPDLTPYPNIPKKTIYQVRNTGYGDFYFRNSNSSIVAPVSSALSATFVKYNNTVKNEIFTKLINFDMFYDTVLYETENFVIFDRFSFNYDTNTIEPSPFNDLYVERGGNKQFEKLSTVWFNEKNNELIFAKTTLFYLNSTTNFKIIYPTVYSFNLSRSSLKKIYPTNELNIEELMSFSLSGTNLNIEFTHIDKPIITYSSDTNLYTLTYVARDTSDLFYIFITTFKYLNGVLSNIRNIMYKPDIDIIHNNFSNPQGFFNYNTYNIAGSSAGTVAEGEFIFAI